MMSIQARNVNDAYVEGLWRLKIAGIKEDSRNGKVISIPEPVITAYDRPCERVLFDAERDANPFFHLYESIWMLAGSDDVNKVAYYAGNMRNYSDDGKILNGAYGHRWRSFFGFDQLEECVEMLQKDPTTRRVVLAMWSAPTDLNSTSKDIPCNTDCYFRIVAGALETTVCCRSNDAVWGAYGANAVHFSVLHEFIATAVGVKPGRMYQFSNNFHIYERHWKLLDFPNIGMNPYTIQKVIPLCETSLWQEFLKQCEEFVNEGSYYTGSFIERVVRPMCEAWEQWKHGNVGAALAVVYNMEECDWRTAGIRWLERRDFAKEPLGEPSGL